MPHLFFISSFSTFTKPHRRYLPQKCPTTLTTRPNWRACEASPVTTPPVPSTQEEIDKLFSRLTHINKNLRAKASASLAQLGDEQTINRLVELLGVENTDHRRAAVKALGMTGLPVLPTIMTILRDSPNPTVRASCSKVLAAVALFFPEERENFPKETLDELEAALENDTNPVTRIATVGCLGTLGSDVKGKDGGVIAAGSQQAVEILSRWCGKASDMAVGATAVGALAQIGQNGTPQRKQSIVEALKKLANSNEDQDDPESGFSYIKEMASSHVEQLESGPKVPDQ